MQNKLLALPVFGKKKTLAAMVLLAEALPKSGNMKTMGLSDNEALPKSGNMKTTGLSDEEDGLSEKEDDDLYLLGHTSAQAKKTKGLLGNPWTDEEHAQFINGIKNYGWGNWTQIKCESNLPT
jgi:hypothetical protein